MAKLKKNVPIGENDLSPGTANRIVRKTNHRLTRAINRVPKFQVIKVSELLRPILREVLEEEGIE